MNYEAWRITFQSSEQAARAAFAEWQKKPAECEPVAWMNPYGGIVQTRRTGLEHETYTLQLYTVPQPCPDCLKWATDMSQVTKTLRYLIGIAERGTATTLPDGVTVESFVLDYVKGLEAKVAELTKERDEAQGRCSEGSQKLTRAEAVIEKAHVTLHNLNIQGGLGYTNHGRIEEALAAITEYREGK